MTRRPSSGAPAVDVAVVLAGGGGTRLWPWTGPERPKPLLPLGGGGRTLLAATLDRLGGVVAADGVRLQAPRGVGERLVRSDGRLDASRLDTEPSPRDTAPAVALAMARVRRRDPGAIVAIVPADQRVEDEDAFTRALAGAARAASEGSLVVLAVRPGSPSTRFGYVELADRPASGAESAVPVRRFVEKPDAEAARALVARGDCYWNAGLFVWRADAFWSELERCAPDVAGPVAEHAESGDPASWERARRTSIDYALMERARGVSAVPLDAGWDDVGSWEAVVRIARDGDAGPAVLVEAEGDAAPGTVVVSIDDAAPRPRRAVVLGEHPLLVVHGPEGLLVSPRGAADGVKRFAG